MKRNFILVLLAYALALNGCALFQKNAAPVDKVAQLEATYTGIATTLLELRRGGKIADDRWKVIKEVNEAVDEGFEVLHLMIDSGDTVGLDDVLAGLKASINRLATYKREAQHGQ